MGCGQRDEENPPVSDDEATAERQKLRPDPEDGIEMKKVEVKVRDYHPEVIVGHSEPLLKLHHLKYLLLGFNCFLMLLGLALLTISVWIRVDPEFWEYETTLKVDNFHAVCAMLIVSSLVVLLVGFLGCFGAVTERRWLLIAYIGIFGIIFLLEMAAVIIMWSAPYSKKISGELKVQLEKQIILMQHDDSSRFFMDFIQENLQCCGASGVLDYTDETPNSCRNSVTGNINEVGCATKMLSYLRTKAGIVGGIALPILAFQLLALMAAGCLIKNLDVESKYFM